MVSRNKDIIFLLGAGASAEASIPPSGKMVQQIEELLKEDGDWKMFLPLYHHIKSAIHYAAGLKGQFGNEVPYNIETLVNTLYELERNEQHPLLGTLNVRSQRRDCGGVSSNARPRPCRRSEWPEIARHLFRAT